MYQCWFSLVAAPNWLNWRGNSWQLAKRQPSTSWLPCFRVLFHFSMSIMAVTVVVCSQPICFPMHRFYYLHVLLSVKVRDSTCIFHLGYDQCVVAFVLYFGGIKKKESLLHMKAVVLFVVFCKHY